MELSKINCSKLRATALVQAIILSRYLFNIGFDFLNDQYSRYCSTQLKNTSKSLSVIVNQSLTAFQVPHVFSAHVSQSA